MGEKVTINKCVDKKVKKEQKNLDILFFPMDRNNVEICINNLGVEIKKSLQKVIRDEIDYDEITHAHHKGCEVCETLKRLKSRLLGEEEKS